MGGEVYWLSGYYRPILLVCIGLWGWGFNLLLLCRQHIDPNYLLHIHPNDKKPYQSIFDMSLVVSLIVAFNMWFYSRLVLDDNQPSWLPLLAYLSVLSVLFWPGQTLYRKERIRFIRLIRRVISFNLFSTVYFGDIIFADLLTSFSNVFGDLFLTLCIVIPGKSHFEYQQLEANLDNACYRDLLVPLIISLPYVIRLRQCISEFIESKYETKRHLFNAMKYASAFPVIALSAIQKKAALYISETGTIPSASWIKDDNLFRLWMLAVFMNSMYSFWWDIAMDWSLIQVTYDHPTKHGVHHPRQSSTPMIRIRRHLHFSWSWVYVLAILLDFVLRITWSLKLSSHIYFQRIAGNIFLVELLEVVRRWLWIIFRLENEWVKRGSGLPTNTTDRHSPSTRRPSASSTAPHLPHQIHTSNDIPLHDRPSKTMLTPIGEDPDEGDPFLMDK
ncbi:EXS-domain-containing protein [Hesseltinella vesiculosa]|uniref:EXS-domain-containing protein n=1 Tax=Hesseltinella vesiculosa TaxID=101127 RepID=A0A1X2GYL6_9FUNG|nr:EXS-domain-containing protein [Hesseltinella vesiculosa]